VSTPLGTLETEAIPTCLKRVRELVQAAAEAAGATPQEVMDAVLAVDEACQNIVRHAYPDAPGPRPLALEIRRNPDTIVFILRDAGVPIDLDAIPSRPPDELRPGGRGLYLIRAVMDRIEHSRDAGGRGNELRLTKRLARGRR
jgi:sigma-B regulation protein RsbU (phosphoserine phosphatase)